jgi:hypothetical protein
MIYVPELIGETVDRMRKFGDYYSATASGTTWTISAKNTLRENEWIVLLNAISLGFEYFFPIVFTDELEELLTSPDVIGQYRVKNVTPTSFQVVSQTTIPSVGSWKSLEPFYLFGHRLEIANRLLEKDKDSVYKYQKYPLIALRMPFTESVSNDQIHDVDLNIVILWYTDKSYTAKKRYDNIVHPYLIPLYFDFLAAIQSTETIMTLGVPEHDKVDRLFWGISQTEGNTKYIFNDPLDAIELINLKLSILNSNC